MAQQNQESSVLFSLNELMSMEQDRIKKESDEKRRTEEAATQAKLDAERRAREEEELRMRTEQERRRSEEQQQREEAARLEAIRHAEVEKARLDAENRARMEAMAAQQAHEREIHALSQDKHKKKLAVIASVVGAFALISVIGLVFAIKKSADEKAAFQAQMQQLLSDEEAIKGKMANASLEERKRLQEELAAKEQAIKGLQDRPTSAAAAVQPKGPSRPVARPAGVEKKPCTCLRTDPLCDCIP